MCYVEIYWAAQNIADDFKKKQCSISYDYASDEEKTKYAFFQKPSKKDDVPLPLPKLIINNYKIQSEECIKFLGVLLKQHLTWKEHIKLAENKILNT